jgi:hypothetical protein
MESVIMLSDIMPSVIKLGVLIQSAITLNIVMLRVVFRVTV